MFFKMKGQRNQVRCNPPDTQRILSGSLFVLKVRVVGGEVNVSPMRNAV